MQELTESEEDILAATKRTPTACSGGQYQRAVNVQNKVSSRLSTSSSKRKTLERGTVDINNRTDRNKAADLSLQRKARKRRSTDRSLHNTAVSFIPHS